MASTVDEQAIISRLKEQVGSVANVLSSPPVDVHLSGAAADSITLGVIRTLMQDMPATKACALRAAQSAALSARQRLTGYPAHPPCPSRC
ncbi:mechanosensitive ion channel protein [Pseudomonas syringae pv. maculicola]|uniref:MscS mechanosensitive ion channel n=1 Tax=Pseudomonas syringae pv. maculicola TaxID=59511 RepID=A0A3M6C216_PSEYM|nr:mechanosensitive ion channel protein [Pseudomonas syringae pv. maculicola]RMV37608.1 MscS mechanosensitive ion channel [Pseudomonas syringae pv. maculicola]